MAKQLLLSTIRFEKNNKEGLQTIRLQFSLSPYPLSPDRGRRLGGEAFLFLSYHLLYHIALANDVHALAIG